MNLLFIAIGGALGSVARYLISESITKLTKISDASQKFFASAAPIFLPSFPWGTFAVNVIGSMLAGVIYFFVVKNFDNFDARLKNFLFAGFLGGFTTFSAFSLDFFRLFSAGQIAQALIYGLLSVVLSILALFFGFYFSKLIF